MAKLSERYRQKGQTVPWEKPRKYKPGIPVAADPLKQHVRKEETNTDVATPDSNKQ